MATGVGVWGNNQPVAWGWAIVNFVFWIGIGHAGTLISAILYFFLGVQHGGMIIQFSSDLSISGNLRNFFLSLYYSVVTFTTLGYGDITPFGFTRIIAALEAFIGSFTIALFVVVFVKRMTR